MAVKTKRRQRRGSAWHWKQTDCWYFTPQGTNRRQVLFDEDGRRIRGVANKQAAGLALARVRLKQGLKPQRGAESPEPGQTWTVARVCSEYLTHCEQAVRAERMHPNYRSDVDRYLNELCRYCGALDVSELKRGHVSEWVDSRPTWRSSATRSNVIAIVLAAFNHVVNEHGVRHRLQGLKKPRANPRLLSIPPEDERALYAAADRPLRDFLFALIHTGLRPFCELAKLTADHVEKTPQGMLWRVYSSKTKKFRKTPVRPEVAKLVRKLLPTAPRRSGLPLFRNSQGNPWKKVTGVHRFLALKRELGWVGDDIRAGYSCYACRHTFAHRMLAGFWNRGAGCTIEVLAELMGNTPSVCFAHYGRQWGKHYQDPLWAALGHGKSAGRRRPSTQH